ncbi:hypothetical protein, partial [Sphingobacterium gobiense]
MKRIGKLCVWLICIIPLFVGGQEVDTLMSLDNIEFVDGSAGSEDDTLLEVPDDLMFRDGAAGENMEADT